MKKLYYIFLLLITFGSCKDDANYPFAGKDAVYFQLQAKVIIGRRLWIVSFILLPARGLSGYFVGSCKSGREATPEGRPVIVVVDEEKTTAEAGLYYEALKVEYVLPGDSVYVNIPVIIYNKDKALENKQVVIGLALKPSEALELGITERLSCRLLVSNMLGKPTYWESTIKYDFGVYSRRKHELCMIELKRDFPVEGSEYSDQRSMWQVYGAYMSDYSRGIIR